MTVWVRNVGYTTRRVLIIQESYRPQGMEKQIFDYALIMPHSQAICKAVDIYRAWLQSQECEPLLELAAV
ncbi:MAG TPA: hypothetical protein VK184_22955 [Nostocaceae cyanobacterium]|nr:hypothetical protein [Nostocaceae cyanobacterium]